MGTCQIGRTFLTSLSSHNNWSLVLLLMSTLAEILTHCKQGQVRGQKMWKTCLNTWFKERTRSSWPQIGVILVDFWGFQIFPKENNENFSFLFHVEPRNLPRSPYLWPRWSGPLLTNRTLLLVLELSLLKGLPDWTSRHIIRLYNMFGDHLFLFQIFWGLWYIRTLSLIFHISVFNTPNSVQEIVMCTQKFQTPTVMDGRTHLLRIVNKSASTMPCLNLVTAENLLKIVHLLFGMTMLILRQDGAN